MSRNKDIQHSVLIVSVSEQFVLHVRKSLMNCLTIDCCKNGQIRAVEDIGIDILKKLFRN